MGWEGSAVKGTARAAARLLVALTLAGTTVVGVPPPTAQGGDIPKENPIRVLQGTGETLRWVDQTGTEVWSVFDGWDLDQYLFRPSSPLNFAIDVDRDFGPVDGDGRPAPGNALFGLTGRITLRVFDVDDDAPVGPEVDELYVNGFLAGTLSGANDQWSVNTFEFPLSQLRLPTASNPQGRNEFWVNIDTTNRQWAVEVDWAALRLNEDFVPLAFVHGFTSSGQTWDDFRDYAIDNNVLVAGEMAAPTHASTNLESGVDEIDGAIADLLVDTGAYHTNMIAHSYGGLVARLYAWDNPSRVDKLVLIGTPNGGLEIADAVCLFKNSNGPWAGVIWGVELFDDAIGDCKGPEDGLFQLQTDYVRNVFNVQVPDRNGTEYSTISGILPDEGRLYDWYPGADDGYVSLDSSEYLWKGRVDHPGKHLTLAQLPLEHGALIQAGSGSMPESMCELYGKQCGAGASASQGRNLAEASDQVLGKFGGVQVPAGGMGSIALQFESAPNASVVLVSDQFDSITPTMPGATFEPAKLLQADVLAATLSSPADGELQITNSGTEMASVIALVAVPAGRALTAAAGDTFVEPASAVDINVTLTEAGVGELVAAEVLAPSGSATPVTLTETGPGAWVGSVTPTEPGVHSVTAWVGGARPRYDSTLFSVSSGQAQLTGSYTERLEGNEDGLADDLVISPQVTVAAAGRYRLSAELADAGGAVIASGGNVLDLPQGTSSVDVPFSGRAIFDGGIDGPYRIVNVVLSRADAGLVLEDEIGFLGLTQAYANEDFDHFRIAFDLDGFTDEAIDLDADGTDDELRVHGSVSVETSGTYAVNARLLAADRTEIAEYQATRTFAVGTNAFTLTFDGDAIAAAGKDGPFLVEDLSVYPTSNSDVLGYLVSAHQTAAYTAAQFTESGWGPVARVNDDATTTSQVAPDVGLGPNGAAIAVWQDYRASPPSDPFSQVDIYSSRWDPTTQTWAANVRVNNVTTGQQYKPSVAVDANNNAYAAWVDWRNGRADIYFSKRAASTGVWSANVRINTATSFNSQDQPTIAVSPNGDAIALWTRTANNKLNVWSSRLPAGGTTWGPEIRVTSNQTTQKQGPKVAFGPTGIAYAVWMDPAVGNADVWYANLPAGSSTWSTNTKISDDPGTAFQGPTDIGVDGSGNVTVAWTDRRATPYQLRVRRLPAGGSWGASVMVAANGGNSPSIAVRGDGRAYLAWHDGDFSTLYPKLWGSSYDPGAGSWSAPERIDTNGPEHGAATPATALDASRILVLWKNALSLDSGENNDDILARVRAP